MTDTTLTNLAYTVPTEFITPTIVEEARPFNIVAPLVLNDVQPPGQGLTWQMPILPTTTAVGVAEGSDITAGSRTPTRAYATIAEVGLSTSLTKLAQEASRLENQILLWAKSSGRAIGQKVTGDLCALLATLGGSSAVGTTNTDLTLAVFTEAIYRLDNANAPGQKRCVLHPIQVKHLFDALSGTSVVSTNLPELIRNGVLADGTPGTGFVGQLYGVPVYQTTEVDTANSAVDRVGAMFVEEAMGFIQLRPITVTYDSDASARTNEIVVTAAYGVCEIVDAYGVPIVSDAD